KLIFVLWLSLVSKKTKGIEMSTNQRTGFNKGSQLIHFHPQLKIVVSNMLSFIDHGPFMHAKTAEGGLSVSRLLQHVQNPPHSRYSVLIKVTDAQIRILMQAFHFFEAP